MQKICFQVLKCEGFISYYVNLSNYICSHKNGGGLCIKKGCNSYTDHRLWM
uniref:Uncharacterized protein n=1 Tax=Anguilla anguilla TaxID=7936 RepID=A0A0E9TU88_ANGAN